MPIRRESLGIVTLVLTAGVAMCRLWGFVSPPGVYYGVLRGHMLIRTSAELPDLYVEFSSNGPRRWHCFMPATCLYTHVDLSIRAEDLGVPWAAGEVRVPLNASVEKRALRDTVACLIGGNLAALQQDPVYQRDVAVLCDLIGAMADGTVAATGGHAGLLVSEPEPPSTREFLCGTYTNFCRRLDGWQDPAAYVWYPLLTSWLCAILAFVLNSLLGNARRRSQTGYTGS